MSARCSACNAPIVWAKHAKTGKANPIDAEASDDGNVEIIYRASPREIIYRIVPANKRHTAGPLHKSHFVTCVDAASFRGGR